MANTTTESCGCKAQASWRSDGLNSDGTVRYRGQIISTCGTRVDWDCPHVDPAHTSRDLAEQCARIEWHRRAGA